jgi:hypothetical protein
LGIAGNVAAALVQMTREFVGPRSSYPNIAPDSRSNTVWPAAGINAAR